MTDKRLDRLLSELDSVKTRLLEDSDENRKKFKSMFEQVQQLDASMCSTVSKGLAEVKTHMDGRAKELRNEITGDVFKLSRPPYKAVMDQLDDVRGKVDDLQRRMFP